MLAAAVWAVIELDVPFVPQIFHVTGVSGRPQQLVRPSEKLLTRLRVWRCQLFDVV